VNAKTNTPFLLVAFLLGASALCCSAAATQPPEDAALLGPAPQEADGTSYSATGIDVAFVHSFPALLAQRSALVTLTVPLGRAADGYIAPRSGYETVNLALGEISPERPVRLYESALAAIADAMRSRLEGVLGGPFYVAAEPADIDPLSGRDLRVRDRRAIGFRVEYTGPVAWVTEFAPLYTYPDLVGQPSITELLMVPVSLVRLDDGQYVAWRPAGVGQPVTLTLEDIRERQAEPYSAAAVQQVLIALRDYVAGRGLMGVQVQPRQADLDAARTQAQARAVEVVITTGVVSDVRTLAAGPRLPGGPERVNNPLHRRIIERSPAQPGSPLMRRELDNYVYWLSRHPGRRVDVGLAPGLEPNTLSLDYMVTENRPLLLYAQVSNTGTRHTGRWRQRFGLFHTQLTNNDDIFNIDYNTAGFDDSHIVSGSYEARVLDFDRLRWRVNGFWNEFDASEVGLPGLRFRGESWGVGGELIANIFQDRQLFLDAVGGVRYLNVEVGQEFFGLPFGGGEESFWLPYAGLRLERVTDLATTRGSLIAEWQPGSGVDRTELNGLGRFNPDRQWTVIQWDLFHSFFLEPVLNPVGWRDPMTPETSTLAHEIALGVRGQHALGNRLIPQVTMVAGGFYSVRGYPEAATFGDTVVLATAEYRFHLPRIFAVREDVGRGLLGEPFRWQPQHVYGRPDWDLIFRGFVDVGRTVQSDRVPGESDDTLLGAGIGAELQIRRNLNLRVDWGFALRDLDARNVESGDSRVHFVGTVLY
jgi:hypothetical protein